MRVYDNRPDSFAIVELNGVETRVSREDLEELNRLIKQVGSRVIGEFGSATPGWCVRSRADSEKMKLVTQNPFMGPGSSK